MRDTSFFIMKRAHSLLGLLSLGFFTILSLIFYSSVFEGAESFDRLSLVIYQVPIEKVLIFIFAIIPISLHFLMELVLIVRGSFNFIPYSFYENGIYVLRRICAILSMFFFAYHIWFTTLHEILSKKLVNYLYLKDIINSGSTKTIYIVGIIALGIYLGTSLQNFLITWGITANKKSRNAAKSYGWLIATIICFWGVLIIVSL